MKPCDRQRVKCEAIDYHTSSGDKPADPTEQASEASVPRTTIMHPVNL